MVARCVAAFPCPCDFYMSASVPREPCPSTTSRLKSSADTDGQMARESNWWSAGDRLGADGVKARDVWTDRSARLNAGEPG